MNNPVILPSDLHRKVLDWLLDYAPTPIMRMVAGYPMKDTVAWYHRIMTTDIDRWAEQTNILEGRTLKQVSMKFIDDGKAAVFIHKPYEPNDQVLTLDQILEPVLQLNRTYRRDHAVEKANDLGLPKLLVGLLGECKDSGNEMQLSIPEGGPAYTKLQQLVDAILIENRIKSDKAINKWGIPLHKLKNQTLQKNHYRGFFFEFINHLSIHLYAEQYNWRGQLFIVVTLPELEAEKQLRKDIDKLTFPEPAPIEQPRKILRSKEQMKADRIGQLSLF